MEARARDEVAQVREHVRHAPEERRERDHPERYQERSAEPGGDQPGGEHGGALRAADRDARREARDAAQQGSAGGVERGDEQLSEVGHPAANGRGTEGLPPFEGTGIGPGAGALRLSARAGRQALRVPSRALP